MKSFKAHLEETAANSVASGGVDMSPGKPMFSKRDKRRKEDHNQMFARAQGLSFIKAMIEKTKAKK